MKTLDESFDDLVFENRNKNYGAYDLRKNYSRRGALAFIVSVSLFFLAAGIPLIANMMTERLNLRNVPVTAGPWKISDIEEPKSIPKPPEPTAPDKKNVVFKPPLIVDSICNKENELEPMATLTERNNSNLNDTAALHKKNETVLIPEPVVEEVFEIFSIQEKPIFHDGDASLIKYIGEHTSYPEEAQVKDIQGTVYIRFVVTKSGEIGETILIRGVDPLLDNEALRVVKSLPRWTPGKNNGNPVNVWFIIPVKFKLQ